MTDIQKYYLWVDNVKGLAIILVVLWHCNYLNGKEHLQWFQHAVPLFLFCSAFLLRNVDGNYYFKRRRLLRLYNRIIRPYFHAELFVLSIIAILCLIRNDDFPYSLSHLLRFAGLGPGSYFPIVYVQCWCVIPFLVVLKRHLSFSYSFALFFISCLISELLFFVVDGQRAWLWRLLAIRYLMILYVGVYYEEFIKRKQLTVVLVILSVVLAVVDIYIYPFHNLCWNGDHCFTSFYILLIIPFLQKLCINRLALVGKYSYEIFLVQMSYLAIISFLSRYNCFQNFLFIDEINLLAISILSLVYIQICKKFRYCY